MKKLVIFTFIMFISLLFVNVSSKEIDAFVENFTSEDLEEIESIEAVIKLSYDSIRKKENKSIDKRRENKKFHSENNKNYRKKINSYNLNISYSSYSPYAFIVFNSFDEYNVSKENLNKLCKSKYIESMTIEAFCREAEANVNSSNSNANIYFDTVENMVGIPNDKNYSGNNIKVGVIDKGYPYLSYGLSDNIVGCDSYVLEDDSRHTSLVMSVITEIAPNVDIYFSRFTASGTQSSLHANIEYLLDNNVQIINMSMRNFLPSGVYDGYCCYIDYIVIENEVLFVKSAGNTGGYVTSPGTSKNIITVGSVSPYYNVSAFSSYGVSSDYADDFIKPNLVAPGEYRIPVQLDATTITNPSSIGTSFAAPIVTGIAALLLEEFPSLQNNIAEFIVLLMASTEKLPSQENIIDLECGSGIINYQNARNLMNNGIIYSTSNSDNYVDELISDFSFQLTNQTQLIMMTISYKDFSLTSNNEYIEQTYDNSYYVLDIYDQNYNYIKRYSSGTYFNIKEMDLEPNNIYICEIIMKSRMVYDNTDYIAVAIS